MLVPAFCLLSFWCTILHNCKDNLQEEAKPLEFSPDCAILRRRGGCDEEHISVTVSQFVIVQDVLRACTKWCSTY